MGEKRTGSWECGEKGLELKEFSKNINKKYWIWYCVLVVLVVHEVEVGSLEPRS